MEIFCLNGYQNEKIQLELLDVLGFPEEISYDGGYDIICRLLIQIGCYHINCDKLYSATGALYRFSDELKRCYANLNGTAKYKLRLENDLTFEIEMKDYGQAIVTGSFQEIPSKENIFSFEMETDQSCFPSVIQGIDALKETFGDEFGIIKQQL